jgi:hypothetical protein
MANEYVHDGLPTPKAIMLAEPFNQSIDSSLAGIPASTEIDCLVGDHDTNVGRTGCDAVWDRTGNVANRDYIWMYSDSHGSPGLTADHFAPTTAPNNTTNALDWYGTWKLTDGLRDCGLYGTNCAVRPGQHQPTDLHGLLERRRRGQATHGHHDQATMPSWFHRHRLSLNPHPTGQRRTAVPRSHEARPAPRVAACSRR